ncbi:rRNA maturation RNase YbeY [Candidatus Dependentiae bacterium]|nr:MAG: rRNA maturation RNase YbeY [Candidatus Dependentiae bacterium]
MILIKNRQRLFDIDEKWMHDLILKMLTVVKYQDFDIAFLLTSDATMRKYNHQFRQKDKATDILSFPYHPDLKVGESIHVQFEEDKNLGDIIISPRSVAKKAEEFDRSFQEHFVILLAHGIAHLLGHDHETDEDFKKMNSLEKRLLRVA